VAFELTGNLRLISFEVNDQLGDIPPSVNDSSYTPFHDLLTYYRWAMVTWESLESLIRRHLIWIRWLVTESCSLISTPLTHYALLVNMMFMRPCV